MGLAQEARAWTCRTTCITHAVMGRSPTALFQLAKVKSNLHKNSLCYQLWFVRADCVCVFAGSYTGESLCAQPLEKQPCVRSGRESSRSAPEAV